MASRGARASAHGMGSRRWLRQRGASILAALWTGAWLAAPLSLPCPMGTHGGHGGHGAVVAPSAVSAVDHHAGHEGHGAPTGQEQGTPQPAPADHPCDCAASCCAPPVVPLPVAPGLVELRVVAVAAPDAPRARDVPRPAPPHRLPFATAPPAT
jgi:hypothetical protein